MRPEWKYGLIGAGVVLGAMVLLTGAVAAGMAIAHGPMMQGMHEDCAGMMQAMQNMQGMHGGGNTTMPPMDAGGPG